MITVLTRVFGAIVSVCLGLSLLSGYISPEKIQILPLFGLIFPYVFILALLGLMMTYKNNKNVFFFLVLLVIISLPHMMAYINLDTFTSKETKANLVVMSFNAMMGKKMGQEGREILPQHKRQIAQLLLSEPIPDILCLQEVNDTIEAFIQAQFDFPYFHHSEKRTTAIFSKYPIEEKGEIDFGKTINSSLWADVKLVNATVRIYSSHLESIKLRRESYEFLTEEGYESGQAVRSIRDATEKYLAKTTQRIIQARMIKEHQEKSQLSIIHCGDFNDPPMSYTYRVLKKGLTDSFLKSGSGLGTTWIGAIPLLRIDYILSSKEIENIGYICVKSDLSDHYPIKASFDLH